MSYWCLYFKTVLYFFAAGCFFPSFLSSFGFSSNLKLAVFPQVQNLWWNSRVGATLPSSLKALIPSLARDLYLIIGNQYYTFILTH